MRNENLSNTNWATQPADAPEVPDGIDYRPTFDPDTAEHLRRFRAGRTTPLPRVNQTDEE